MSSGIQLLRRNVLSNAAGIIVPSLGWMLAIPFFVRGLGDQAFGAYMVVMSIAGFLSVLELETSSAATKYIAEIEVRSDLGAIERIISTNFVIHLGFGLVVILCTSFFSPLLASLAFSDTSMSKQELSVLIRLVGVLSSLGLLRRAMSGVPRGFQRYDIHNAVGIGYSATLIVTQISIVAMGGRVTSLVVGNILVSAASVLVYMLVVRQMVPGIRFISLPHSATVRMLLPFGMYMTASNVAGTIFITGDKLIVGRILGAAMVTYYAVPLEIISRIRRVVAESASVFLPLTSELHSRNELEELRRLYLRGNRLLMVLMALPIVFVSVFSWQLLRLWISSEFAALSTPVMAVVGLGYLFYSMAIMPYHVLVGIGRPRRMSLLHLAIVAIILLSIVGGAIGWGLFGAAVGMMLGMTTMALFPWTVQHQLGISWGRMWRDGFGWTLLYSILTVIAGMALSPDSILRVLLYVAFVAALLRWGNVKEEDWQSLRSTLVQLHNQMKELRAVAGRDSPTSNV